jgi:flagellar protein FlaI
MAVSHGGHFVRRVLSVTELERYYEPENKMITREVFSWDSVNDKFIFRGLYNSYILEKKIALMLGFQDTRQIYTEMDKRQKILDKMIEQKIFNYFDVWEIIKNFHIGGEATLPFAM